MLLKDVHANRELERALCVKRAGYVALASTSRSNSVSNMALCLSSLRVASLSQSAASKPPALREAIRRETPPRVLHRWP
jgi:hypothetical protein